MTIQSWLTSATSKLAEAGIPSARLDAELLLAHVLDTTRTWVIAHIEEAFSGPELRHQANTLLTKRIHRMPLAYLTGVKEFYGRNFIITPAVLIPRPETETVIELLISLAKDVPGRLIDVGCGSGCIAITAKLELPQLQVTAADISQEALDITSQNAERLDADITTAASDLLVATDGTFDYIVSNPPYVDRTWERSPETEHEPEIALFADDKGLGIIYRLIEQSSRALRSTGHLLIEADPIQHDAIKDIGAAHGLRYVRSEGYIVVLQRP